ncbi:MAG: ribbon-helix-helix domain-containing protein [Patescibacteria group bacterium]
MRSVMNISLPKELAQDIERGVKEGKYASKSEFMRDLVRSWNQAQLVKELDKMRKEFIKGKGKLLKSLADLD